MRYLVIITRQTNEFNTFWKFSSYDTLAVFTENENTLLIIEKSEEKSIENYALEISSMINTKKDFEAGVIFHERNGNATAAQLKNNFPEAIRLNISFCEWYSGTKTDFWNESDINADLPYNNLKKAWKDNEGSKENTFKIVWDFFFGDPELEKLLKAFENEIPLTGIDDELTARLNRAKLELKRHLQL